MKLDLSKFKKVSSNEHSTTMMHPDGHMIQVAHKALSPKMRDQLQGLEVQTKDQGGSVSDSPPEAPKKNAKAMQEGATSSGVPSMDDVVKNVKESLGMAKGGETSDPTQRNLLPGDSTPNAIEKNVVDQAKSHISKGPNNPKLAESKKQPPKAKAMADGGDSSADDQPSVSLDPSNPAAIPSAFINPNPGAQAAEQAGVTNSLAGDDTPYGVTPEDAAKLRVAHQLKAQAVDNATTGAQPQESDNDDQSQQQQPQGLQPPSIMGAYGKEMQGLQQEAAANSNLGQAQAGVLQNQAAAQKNALDHYQQAYQDLDQENQNFMDDVAAGHIDPKQFLGDMSTLQKAKTGIGLILGGIGGGLTHQGNPALQFLNAQIDRDIQAQQSNLANKQTLLSANLHRFGNLRDATDMTRLMMNGMVQSELQAQAAKAATPLAQANLLKAQGALQAQQAPMFQQMAMRQALMKGGQQGADPSAFVPYVVPAEHQKAVFGEIQAAQNTQHMGDSILNAFDQATNDNTVLKTGAGMARTPASVYALHQAMQPTFADLEGTVRQAAMDNTFKNITPQPGDMQSTIDTKRNALKLYLQSKMAAPTAKAYGIDLQQFRNTTQNPYERLNPQQQQFAAWAKQNQANPQHAQKAAAVLKKLGLQ